MPARYAIKRGQWAEAARLDDPKTSKFPFADAIRYFARVLGGKVCHPTHATPNNPFIGCRPASTMDRDYRSTNPVPKTIAQWSRAAARIFIPTLGFDSLLT